MHHASKSASSPSPACEMEKWGLLRDPRKKNRYRTVAILSGIVGLVLANLISQMIVAPKKTAISAASRREKGRCGGNQSRPAIATTMLLSKPSATHPPKNCIHKCIVTGIRAAAKNSSAHPHADQTKWPSDHTPSSPYARRKTEAQNRMIPPAKRNPVFTCSPTVRLDATGRVYASAVENRPYHSSTVAWLNEFL